ncbi:MAG TPA: amidohydrolase family protein [Pirellulales bacterium]|jgi:predicted TIM-barrel fold metal-dependent hydrolase|nr:amidohydrolase family protein [Pirellulales bacterium]
MSAQAANLRDAAGYIDAHSHIWTPDRAAYPLAEGFDVGAMQPPSFTPVELFEHCRPAGVSRVVLIQMSFYRFDNSYMLDSLERYPGVFSAVGIVDEQAPQVGERMRALARRGVRGFRISPGIQPAGAARVPLEKWLDSAGMAAMWSAATEQKLAICPLINPEVLPAIDRMCGRYPAATVVIDHFARIGLAGSPRAEDLDQLCRLARFDQVYVKTSAFYALGAKQAPYLDLAPQLRRLRDAFGAERLMWASDCPFQVQKGHTYAASIALVRERLDFLSADEREWMLKKTAAKVFFGSEW